MMTKNEAYLMTVILIDLIFDHRPIFHGWGDDVLTVCGGIASIACMSIASFRILIKAMRALRRTLCQNS